MSRRSCQTKTISSGNKTVKLRFWLHKVKRSNVFAFNVNKITEKKNQSINVCIPPLFLCKRPPFSGTFCNFLCHLRWMLDSDFAGLELFCVLLRTHNALGFVFLCFLFSLPSTSSSPHLHLPNPSLSNVHLAEECITLQSWQYVPNLPVVGAHVCVYANILAPRCIVEASERVITYARFCIAFFQHVFSTVWTLVKSMIHPLCVQLFWCMLEDGTPFNHSIIVLICRATARPSKGFNRTRQSNQPHSFGFILASLSLLWPSFFLFFLPSFVSHWVHQRLEAHIAHNWNHGTNIHS